MSTNIEALKVSALISVDLSGVRKGVKDAENELSKVGANAKPAGLDKFVGEISGKLKSVGAGMATAGAALTAAFTAPVALAIKNASDLSESLNKVQVVFGNSAAKVEEFAKTTSTALGISQQDALAAAGTFGNLFVAMKIGQPAAAEMSKSLTTLAADLGSFNNLEPTEVLEKLRAGITGEAEPLKSLGILINETTVKAKAMELGFKAVGGQLTEQQKVAARYALIMEQSAVAQGDFARTSDGLANATRIAKAQFETLTANLGQTFLPLVNQAVNYVNGLFQKFKELPEPVQKAITVIAGVGAVLGPLLVVIGGIVSAVGTALPVITGLGSALAGLASPVGIVIAAIVGLVVAYKTNFLGLRDSINALASDLKQIFDRIVAFIRAHADDFRTIWEGVKTVVMGVVTAIGLQLSALIDIVRAVLKAINGDWSGAWELIKSAGAKLAQATTQLIGAIFKGLVYILAGIWGLIRDGVFSAWNGIVNFFTSTVPNMLVSFLQWWQQLPGRIVGFLLELPAKLGSIFGQLAGTAVRLTVELVTGVISFFRQLPATLSNLAVSAWNFVKSAFSSGVQYAIDAAINLHNGLVSWFQKIPSLATDAFNRMLSFLTSLPSELWNKAVSIGQSIWDGFRDGLGIHSPSGPEKDVAKMDAGLQMLLAETAGKAAPAGHRVGKAIHEGFVKGFAGLTEATKSALESWLSEVNDKATLSEAAWAKLPKSARESFIRIAKHVREGDAAVNQSLLEHIARIGRVFTTTESAWARLPEKVRKHITATYTSVKINSDLIERELADLAKASELNIDKATAAFEKLDKETHRNLARATTALLAASSGFKLTALQSAELTLSFEALQRAIEEFGKTKGAEESLKSLNNEFGNTIESISKLADQLGLVGNEKIKFVTEQFKQIVAELPPATKESWQRVLNEWQGASNRLVAENDKTVTSFRQQFDRLANLIGDGFADAITRILQGLGKLNVEALAKFNDTAEGILDVIGNLPGKIGDKLRGATNTVIDWVNRIDGILRGLHKIFKDVPNGLGEALEKFTGIFKKTQATVTQTTDTLKQQAKAAATGVSQSTGEMAESSKEAGAGISKAFGVAMSAVGAFTSGLATAAATGSKAIGSLMGGLQGAMSGFATGGPVGAIIGGAAGILGGLFGGKSAAQKEQERLQMERLKQDVQKGAQEVMQTALDTIEKALGIFDKIGDFTKTPRRVIEKFFQQLKLVADLFVQLSKGWTVSMLDGAKAFAERVQPILEAIGAGVEAFEKLALFSGVPERAITAFGKALDSAVALFVRLSDSFEAKAVRAAKKFAVRVTDIVNAIGVGVAAFTALSTFGGVPIHAFELFGAALELAVVELGRLAADIPNRLEKEAAKFAVRASEVVAVISNAVSAFAALTSIQPISSGAFSLLKDALAQAVSKLAEIAGEIAGEMLVEAQAFAEKAGAVIQLVGAAVQSFAGLSDFTKSIPDALANLGELIKQAVAMMVRIASETDLNLVGKAATFANSAKSVVELIKTAVESFNALDSIQNVELGTFNALEIYMRRAVELMARIADQLGAELLDKANTFAAKTKSVYEVIKVAVDAFKALSDLAGGRDAAGGNMPSLSGVIEAVLEQMKAAIAKLGEVSETISAEAINKANAFATKLAGVFGIIKSAFESYKGIQEFINVPTFAIFDVAEAMRYALGEIEIALSLILKGEGLVVQFRDAARRIAAAFAEAGAVLSGFAGGATQTLKMTAAAGVAAAAISPSVISPASMQPPPSRAFTSTTYGDTYYNVTIDAKAVREFNDVVEAAERERQERRARGSRR